MCVWSIYTFWYIDMPDVTAIYGTPYDFMAFFWLFSYIIIDHSCLNCCIFIKLSLIVYLVNTDMSKFQMWLQVVCLPILLCFFCELCTKLTNIHAWSVLSSPNIHILCIIKCQVWLQVMERFLILLCFLDIFIHYWRPFMSEVLYLRQTFTDYVPKQYIHSDMLTFQM